MRKIICLVLALLFTVPFAVSASDEYASVQLELQIGSYVAYVNGEAMSVEAPFLKDGITLAPVEAVSAAFGKKSKNKVSYNGITLEFFENNTMVKIGEDEKYMPTPAVNVNGSLMIPVRFVCDVYNALIEYEEETEIIRINKSADFSDLFNKQLSGYWCDEDYGWMLQLPTEYSHIKNVYDGSTNQFINGSNDAAFILNIKKNDYQTIEQVRMYIIAQNRGDILRHEEIIELSDGTRACYFEFEDYAALVTIHDEFFYALEFVTTSGFSFEKYREDARNGIKSFTFEIDKSKKPENVSTLNEGGFAVYTDKILGFTVNRMESWTEPTFIGTNVAVWEYAKHELISKLCSDEFFDGEMKVSVFSKEEGDTPEKLAQAEKEKVLTAYNKKFLSDVYTDTYMKKGEMCSEIGYTIVYNGRKQINKVKFFVKDDYFYRAEYYIVFTYGLDEDKINTEYVADMFDSIRIKGVDTSKLGVVIDVSRIIDENVLQAYTNQHKNFEISVPAAWVTAKSANHISTVNLKKNIEIEAERFPSLPNIEKARAFFEKEYPGAVFHKETFQGKSAYKMNFSTYTDIEDKINCTAYFFAYKKEIYCVSYSIKEVYETPETIKFIDGIIKTFKVI